MAFAWAASAASSRSRLGRGSWSKLPYRSTPRTSVAESRTFSCFTSDGMERHLAGVENAVDRAAGVNLHSNLLPAREEVVLVERIDVLHVILRLRARQEF